MSSEINIKIIWSKLSFPASVIMYIHGVDFNKRSVKRRHNFGMLFWNTLNFLYFFQNSIYYVPHLLIILDFNTEGYWQKYTKNRWWLAERGVSTNQLCMVWCDDGERGWFSCWWFVGWDQRHQRMQLPWMYSQNLLHRELHPFYNLFCSMYNKKETIHFNYILTSFNSI